MSHEPVRRRPLSTPLSTPLSSNTPPLPTSNVTTPSSTPSTTPVKRSSNRYSDRFIPSRVGSGDLRAAFDLLRHSSTSTSHSSSCENTAACSNFASPPASSPITATPTSPSQYSPSSPAASTPSCYSLLLKSELLDAPPRPPSLHLASASPPPSLPAAARLAAKNTPSMRPSSTSAITTSALHHGLEGLTRLSATSPMPSPHVTTPMPAIIMPGTTTPITTTHQHAATTTSTTTSTITSASHAQQLDQAQFLQGTHQLHPQSLRHHYPHHSRQQTTHQQPTTPNMFRFRTGLPDSYSTSWSGGTPSANTGSPFSTASSSLEASANARSALLSAASAASPGRATRKIARAPFKVLDAPSLKDDFYLNLVDWSSRNVLAVGLGSCVYLWSACTSVVTKLCDLQFGGSVCSVAWSASGTELAVGTQPGQVQVWDTTTCKLLRTMTGHTARAGCLAWNSTTLSSGGRDKEIFNRDLRCSEAYVARLSGHRQEVCGLRWSPDETQLASGGNDNKLLIWSAACAGGSGGLDSATSSNVDGSSGSPLLKFTYHNAAVKAIAWSPHARGLLASGGGTADRRIRFWNTMTNSALAAVDTGSQVCNLAWSKNVNEMVSTHGYSQNQIIVWKYPSLSKVVTLMGHSYRVLYLAVSPSGETIVTGAGDETLRFWNVFPAARNQRGSCENTSQLSAMRMSIR